MMKKSLSRFVALLMGLVLLLGFSVTSFASGNTDEVSVDSKYEALILDSAGLLTENEENQLYEDMKELLPYGNVIFSSVDLNNGEDYEKYSESTYYDHYGNEPGVIFQIDMGNRKLTLSASTDMEKEISGERDSIVDNIYQYATDGDYYDCAAECFNEIDLVLHDGKIAHSMKYIDNAVLALTLALILNFVFIFATTKRKTSTNKLLGAMTIAAAFHGADVRKGFVSRRYDPHSSGGGGGGGFSGGGGGGGGGFSGGSSSHGF